MTSTTNDAVQAARERICDLLNYDPDSGAFTWRRCRGPRPAGSPAGFKASHGYVRLKIGETTYRAHRLAWLIVKGVWPAHEIDHINGDPADNRIANLREATRSQNASNLRKVVIPKSGFPGVTRMGKRSWCSRLRTKGKSIFLGTFRSPEEAHAAYLSARRLHFGDFAFDRRASALVASVRDAEGGA